MRKDDQGNAPAILVTGSRGGVGSALCRRLLAMGDRVVGLDVVEGGPADDAHGAGHGGAMRGGGMRHYRLAGHGEDAIVPLMTDIVATVGRPAGIVFCAGIYPCKPLSDYSAAGMTEVFASNLIDSLLMLKILMGLPPENASQPAPLRVVFVGSQATVAGTGDPIYTASKAAIVGAMKSLTMTHSNEDLLFNCVSLGPTRTPMLDRIRPERMAEHLKRIPLGRAVEPDEVADTITWLLHAAPAAINGSVIDIDGGLSRR
ncbi:short-chain dehydrogenase/reductase SD [Azospirillum sp. B510]|uniref:SDR family NAD(P)-dependent oxidoreductase n=1 Tax=Azospirillum sp. (strain B510) TaxID=137722 RepID=UPI0001C4C284|nr:SDR family oxidoreductase [Azospirillum sp. B510]BAI72496.1 short-chain dehydrogenase/reductase SD [Azospirillum sp. B510]